MSTRIQYLTYYIVLTDEDQVIALSSTPTYLAAGGINRAPYDPGPPAGGAAIEFNAPFKGYAQLTGNDAPYIWTPWSGIGSQAGPYPLNVATFQRHTGGFFGLGGTTTRYYWLGQFVYAGTKTSTPSDDVVVDPPATVVVPAVPIVPDWEKAPLAVRYAVEGFEQIFAGVAAGSPGASGNHICRDAARHTGGFGLGTREVSNAVTTITLSTIVGGPGAAQASVATKFRMRLRALPSAATEFCRFRLQTAPAAGFALGVDTLGRLTLWNISNATVYNNLGSFGDVLPTWTGLGTHNAWRNIDILADTNSDNTHAYIRVLVNKELAATFSIPSADSGFASNGDLINTVNLSVSSGANTLEVDLDDHVTTAMPPGSAHKGTNGALRNYDSTAGTLASYLAGDLIHRTYVDASGKSWLHFYKCRINGPLQFPTPYAGGEAWHRYEGLDWMNGSKIVLARPKAFSANQGAGWTGKARTCGQLGFSVTSGVVAQLTTATPSTILAIDTDVDTMARSEPGSLGAVAVQLSCNSLRGATAVNATIGYNAAGAGVVSAATVESNGTSLVNRFCSHIAAAVSDPIDLATLELRYTKPANADAVVVKALTAQVELIGQFWAEDFYRLSSIDIAPDGYDFVGQHNAPYVRSPWATAGPSAPVSPVQFKAGTYVGNGTDTDLTFREPIHFLWIRPLTGGAGGHHWWSTVIGSHKKNEQAVSPMLVDQREDTSYVPGAGEVQQQQYILKLTGADTQFNANAVTYQYFAISDPGQRFMLNGCFAHDVGSLSPMLNPLINSNFLPEWLFTIFEDASSGGTTARLYIKGPGNAAETICGWGAAVVNTALSMTRGLLTSKAALHTLLTQGAPFSAWRRSDGNADPGEPGVVALVTWIGDGSASRTVSWLPASGKRPLWAMVVGENSSGSMRDPSHTLTNSTPFGGVDTITGITGGGIDSISVGSILNANGIVYNAIIFLADATAGNGGWGTNGEYTPVEAAAPVDGPWPSDPDEGDVQDTNPTDFPPAAVDETTDVDPGDLTTDIAAACVGASTRLVNIALSRMGVSKKLASLATDVSQEAESARTVYKTEIDATLRDFVWPFATRYATLVRVGGTDVDSPVNGDWTFSYRAPADAVFVRRVVNPAEKRGFSRTPIPFKVTDDGIGAGLIYCDEPGATLPDGDPVTVEYTARLDCPAQRGDAIFRSAAAWRLAAALVAPLARDLKLVDYCEKRYQMELRRARTVHAQEQEQQHLESSGNADWIDGR